MDAMLAGMGFAHEVQSLNLCFEGWRYLKVKAEPPVFEKERDGESLDLDLFSEPELAFSSYFHQR